MVKILEVNLEKNQISLSIKAAQEASRPQREHRERQATRDGAPRGEGRRGKRGGGERPAAEKTPLVASGNASPVKPAGAPVALGDPANAPVRPRAPGGPKPAAKPKEAFNNAFAGLAALKAQLKK
jgi:hypothetical protein